MKFLLHLAYNGTRFSGWQRQVNTNNTIQENIETQLSKLCKGDIRIHGCGRTDKGVHSEQYIAHFSAHSKQDNWVYKLNKMVSQDIKIHSIVAVDEKFNARFDATSRVYRYFFHTSKNPFINEISAYYPKIKNVANHFNAIKSDIANNTEFAGFCKSPQSHDSTRCTIHAISLYQNENTGRYCFEIAANRFLRGMIRILMFYFLEICGDNFTVEKFIEILKTGENPLEVQSAYPQGLFLTQVKYNSLKIAPIQKVSSVLLDGLSQVS